MRELVALTAEQKKLVREHPGLAERAARDVAKHYGQIRRMDEMIASAHYGIALAAKSYEPAMGSFADWAYHKAVWTILDDARVDGRQRNVLAAGRLVAVAFTRHAVRRPRDEDADNTEAQDRAELDAYKSGVIAAFMQGAALMPTAAGGEDEMNERIDAMKAATALKRVYDELEPHQVELLQCEHEADLQALAAKWGKSWWTLARAKAKLQQVVGARLVGKKVVSMPAWNDDVWRMVAGHLIDTSPDADAVAP